MLRRVAFFYADNDLIDFTNREWLQGAFDTLTGLFGRVVPWTNYGKMVRMLFRPFRAFLTHSEESYKHRMIGEGLTYLSYHRLKVQCPDCGAYMSEILLVTHLQTQYSVGLGS